MCLFILLILSAGWATASASEPKPASGHNQGSYGIHLWPDTTWRKNGNAATWHTTYRTHQRPYLLQQGGRTQPTVRTQRDGRARVVPGARDTGVTQQLMARDAQHRIVGRQRGSDLPRQVAGAPRLQRVCIVQSNEDHSELTSLLPAHRHPGPPPGRAGPGRGPRAADRGRDLRGGSSAPARSPPPGIGWKPGFPPKPGSFMHGGRCACPDSPPPAPGSGCPAPAR